MDETLSLSHLAGKWSIPSVTMVTACFDMRKYHSRARNMDETIAGLDVLLNMPIYLIIHCDAFYLPHIREKRTKFGFDAITQYVEETWEELWASSYIDKVKQNRAAYWPTMDHRTCAESHLLCCNKFDFVQQAIQKNPFQTSLFGWIDAHLHVGGETQDIKIAEQYTTNFVPQVLSQIDDDKFHIQVLNVNDKKFLMPEHKREFYQHYRWVVCGSFFVCGPTVGMKILERLKEVMHTTTEAGYGHAEEMFFLEVLEEFPQDIVKSYGDYRQILNNFLFPTRNLGYIYEYIVKGYFQRQYYSECIDCCQTILVSFERYLVPKDYLLYMKTLLYYYLSAISDPRYHFLEPIILKNVATLCENDVNASAIWDRVLEEGV